MADSCPRMADCMRLFSFFITKPVQRKFLSVFLCCFRSLFFWILPYNLNHFWPTSKNNYRKYHHLFVFFILYLCSVYFLLSFLCQTQTFQFEQKIFFLFFCSFTSSPFVPEQECNTFFLQRYKIQLAFEFDYQCRPCNWSWVRGPKSTRFTEDLRRNGLTDRL